MEYDEKVSVIVWRKESFLASNLTREEGREGGRIRKQDSFNHLTQPLTIVLCLPHTYPYTSLSQTSQHR